MQTSGLNIGVDATVWHNTRGYGRHARSLLTHLIKNDPDNRYTLVLDSDEGLERFPNQAQVRVVNAAQPTAVAASAKGRRSLADMWQMSRTLSERAFDVVLFPSIYSFTPVFTPARKIVFIHDIIPEKYPQLTFPKPRARLLWRLKLAAGRRQADAIVTVSEYSRRQISGHFGLDPSLVFVVGEASDPVFRPLEAPVPTPHLKSLGVTSELRPVLYVGGFGPHKNIESLIRAFGRISNRDPFQGIRLFLVGEYQKEVFYSQAGRLQQLVSELGLEQRVVFTGYLPDEELVVLLNLGAVLVLPSWMEGFGLPAVEAAACGCAVIATQNSPLPELLGEGCIAIDPGDLGQLEGALIALLGSEDLRRATASAGAAAAARLTWDNAADQLRRVIQSVAAA